MRIRTRFNFLLLVGLLASLSVKTFVAAAVLRPSGEEIVDLAGRTLSSNGFQVAGVTKFAGRTALMAQKSSCLVYAIPVSEQGWHQETVRTALLDGQRLYFIYGAETFQGQQPRWAPLFRFYTSFALAHAGLGPGYSAVVALVASDDCNVQTIDWSGMKPVPYSRKSIISHQENEDF